MQSISAASQMATRSLHLKGFSPNMLCFFRISQTLPAAPGIDGQSPFFIIIGLDASAFMIMTERHCFHSSKSCSSSVMYEENHTYSLFHGDLAPQELYVPCRSYAACKDR
jgi:hypothetical protein